MMIGSRQVLRDVMRVVEVMMHMLVVVLLLTIYIRSMVVVVVVISKLHRIARVFVEHGLSRTRLGGSHCSQDLGLLALGHPAKADRIARHAHCDALLESAVLAPVPVDAHYRALLVLGARAVLDLLLDRAPEEAFAALTRVNAVVEAGRLVAAHLAQDGLAVELDGLLGVGRVRVGARLLVLALVGCCAGHVEACWCVCLSDCFVPMCSGVWFDLWSCKLACVCCGHGRSGGPSASGRSWLACWSTRREVSESRKEEGLADAAEQ